EDSRHHTTALRGFCTSIRLTWNFLRTPRSGLRQVAPYDLEGFQFPFQILAATHVNPRIELQGSGRCQAAVFHVPGVGTQIDRLFPTCSGAQYDPFFVELAYQPGKGRGSTRQEKIVLKWILADHRMARHGVTPLRKLLLWGRLLDRVLQ